MEQIIEEAGFRNKNHIFRDRPHAGQLLAKKLEPYMNSFSNPVILAIPSGGVPVGYELSKELGCPMDLLIVRKIQIPYEPEAGFGSVSWEGEVLLNKNLVAQLHLSSEEIDSSIKEVKHELKLRMKKFRGDKPFPELKDRSVIIADDGLASGYTMLSSIHSVNKYSPADIIVAIPTASSSAIKLISPEVDMLFCLNIRESSVFAVADAYLKWHDLTEQEVIELIREYEGTN